MSLNTIFSKPCVISITADINQGKSMLIYHLIKKLAEENTFNLYTYGLHVPLNHAQQVYSVEELEQIENSIIFIDELSSLFDLDNGKSKRIIEKTLRTLHHNNNILVLCGTPENFKKFISAKVEYAFFKKIMKADLINQSRMKNIVEAYRGGENGSSVLNLAIDEALFYDGRHYSKVTVPYYKEYDTKAKNEPILKKIGK